MMNPELEELYQHVLLDHSKRPRNFGPLQGEALHAEGVNPSCGDEIEVWLRLAPDGKISELTFAGQGCAISQASASLMTLKLRGKSPAEAEKMLGAFQDLVTGEREPDTSGMGDLILFQGVRKFPQRVKCAMLAWRAMESALRQGGGKVATE
jgi:nitrogen fixation NifU-like protein